MTRLQSTASDRAMTATGMTALAYRPVGACAIAKRHLDRRSPAGCPWRWTIAFASALASRRIGRVLSDLAIAAAGPRDLCFDDALSASRRFRYATVGCVPKAVF
jgi:hypothetical protein